MGENWNSDTTGLLLCSTRHQSHDCTAREESPRLADGLGEAADVQLSQEARAGSGGLKRPRSEARRPPLFLEQYRKKRWLGDLRFKISRKALGLVTLQHQLCHRRVEALSKLTEAQRRAQSPDEDSCTGSFRRQFGLVPTRLRRGSALTRSLQSETPTSIGGSARTLPLGTSISLSSSPSQLWYVVEDQLLDPSRSPLLPSHVETTIVDEPLRAANVIPLNGSLWTRRRSRDTSIKDGISKCRHRRRHEDVDGARGLGGLQEDGEEVADGDEASKIEYTRPKEVQVQRLVQPYSSGGQNRTPPWLVDR
ncbi:predicted protein [Chaetomium globosum CBS 148.51]|uniref:Uncharacterized protein n=1 Tax=Chaetomium globosum (strain ATCC 6205 / CBS 148.51 / DSM 1962 / NBRC 6347 / NRRL 1970) TaxID=306901 RepID=Q2HF33_CHAGB|nr:uncharacterized protein CHGG_01171 [Chaetomium globosum CBS 148.51]EAQ92936.1 predicted protein [Chaetomium globosum CBS 148.51]